METRYKWPPFISEQKKTSLKQELHRILKEDLIRCSCKQLTIRFHTFNLDTHFRAELQCECGTSDKWGFVEGVIPEAVVTEKIFEERRFGKVTRAAIDRRKTRDTSVMNTRVGKDRRSGKDRRKSGERNFGMEA